jgi:hypothetical protein
MGRGAGYVDPQLITSTLLMGVSIWALDKKLSQVTEGLQIKYVS